MPLDKAKTYKAYDKQQISACNEMLPLQVTSAWEDTRGIRLPVSYKKVQNVIVAGMGGSALGAHILKSVFANTLKAPVEIVRDYALPKYVSRSSLVVLSSFSGNTEEVLSAAKLARKKKAKLVVITTGGKLKRFMARNALPGYIFEPGESAKQPRFGIGFSFIGLAGLLERVGLLRVTKADMERMRKAMNDVVDISAQDVETSVNPAKTVAHELHQKAVLIVSAEHLLGNAHVFSNQINETAKQFAMHLTLPELNHHFLEGLTFPKAFFQQFSVIMLRSALYNKRTQKRFDLTADIFEKKGGTVIDYDSGGDTRIEEAGEVLQFGSFTACYLAMLNKTNPYDIPYVDDLKKRMRS